MNKKIVSLNSVEKSLSHSADKIRRRTLRCFERILVSKIFMNRRGRGITVLSIFFVSQDRNEKLCKGTLLFSGNFLVSKKVLWIRGGLSRFSVEISMSHSAENFCKGILLFLRKFLGSKSFMDKKGVSCFSVEKIWSHGAEKFRGHPFNVSENLGYRKILCIIGGITIFRLKFVVLQCRKIS